MGRRRGPAAPRTCDTRPRTPPPGPGPPAASTSKLDRVLVGKARLADCRVRGPQAEAAGVPDHKDGVLCAELGDGTHPRVRVQVMGVKRRRVPAAVLVRDGEEVADRAHLVVGPARSWTSVGITTLPAAAVSATATGTAAHIATRRVFQGLMMAAGLAVGTTD